MPTKRAAATVDPPPTPPAVDADPVMLNRREAAERAGVHYNTIRLWESQRLLHPKRINVGRRQEVRIDADELDRVAAERAEARPPEKPGQLALTGDQLWGMVQQAGSELATEVERRAKLEVESAFRAQEAQRLATENQQLRAELDEQRRRNQWLEEQLIEVAASGRRWWQRRRASGVSSTPADDRATV